jgi:hypothetical protein
MRRLNEGGMSLWCVFLVWSRFWDDILTLLDIARWETSTRSPTR